MLGPEKLIADRLHPGKWWGGGGVARILQRDTITPVNSQDLSFSCSHGSPEKQGAFWLTGPQADREAESQGSWADNKSLPGELFNAPRSMCIRVVSVRGSQEAATPEET